MPGSHPASELSLLSPGKRLRHAIAERAPVELMAAHSPLSARLAEAAGFDGLWASGFELSALYGVADASLVSMTQHLEMTRAMVAATTVPVVADLDTGFGNAINLIHAVRLYEQAGVAAVVIEDKTFPKTTSLLPGGRQDLVRVEEFQGKVAAACAARRDPDLIVVGRTEALIAGLGQAEALRRAYAYEEAGADLILVHSRQSTPEEIERVATAWTGRARLAIVPTSYPAMTLDRARRFPAIGMLIHGNHAIRASVAGMQRAFAAIRATGETSSVRGQIATVEEIFRLQGMDQVREDEEQFLR